MNYLRFSSHDQTKVSVFKNVQEKALPYIQLMRLHRPIGTWLLLWPCYWSLAFGMKKWTQMHLLSLFFFLNEDKFINKSWQFLLKCESPFCVATPAGSLPDLRLIGLFAIGSIVMRGAGCTINDIIDRDIDMKVARTKTRPIASGAITIPQAFAFLGLQLSCGLAVLLSLNNYA